MLHQQSHAASMTPRRCEHQRSALPWDIFCVIVPSIAQAFGVLDQAPFNDGRQVARVALKYVSEHSLEAGKRSRLEHAVPLAWVSYLVECGVQ
eukprot:3111128-Prymnesium_polylepis.1